MSEENRIEKPTLDDRIEILRAMLNDAKLPSNEEKTRVWSDFGKELVERLSTGAPNVGFWQKMNCIRQEQPSLFDEVARCGFNYAEVIVYEWLGMKEPTVQKLPTISEGPQDGSCTG
jgi:hypothetical protein